MVGFLSFYANSTSMCVLYLPLSEHELQERKGISWLHSRVEWVNIWWKVMEWVNSSTSGDMGTNTEWDSSQNEFCTQLWSLLDICHIKKLLHNITQFSKSGILAIFITAEPFVLGTVYTLRICVHWSWRCTMPELTWACLLKLAITPFISRVDIPIVRHYLHQRAYSLNGLRKGEGTGRKLKRHGHIYRAE